jgi:hypothetical protein
VSFLFGCDTYVCIYAVGTGTFLHLPPPVFPAPVLPAPSSVPVGVDPILGTYVLTTAALVLFGKCTQVVPRCLLFSVISFASFNVYFMYVFTYRVLVVVLPSTCVTCGWFILLSFYPCRRARRGSGGSIGSCVLYLIAHVFFSDIPCTRLLHRNRESGCNVAFPCVQLGRPFVVLG